MLKLTTNQQTLVKARKAARMVSCLLIFGGAVLLVLGLNQQILQEVMNGVVLFAGAVLAFAFSKIIEKKINALGS